MVICFETYPYEKTIGPCLNLFSILKVNDSPLQPRVGF